MKVDGVERAIVPGYDKGKIVLAAIPQWLTVAEQGARQRKLS